MPEDSRCRPSAMFECPAMPDRAVCRSRPPEFRSTGGEREPSADSSTLHVFRNSGVPEDMGGHERRGCPGVPEVSGAWCTESSGPPEHALAVASALKCPGVPENSFVSPPEHRKTGDESGSILPESSGIPEDRGQIGGSSFATVRIL